MKSLVLRRLLYHLRVSSPAYLLGQLVDRLRVSVGGARPEPRPVVEVVPPADTLRICVDPSLIPADARPDPAVRGALVDSWLDHRFDVLGSGWLHAGYGAASPGLEGFHYHDLPAVIPASTDDSWLSDVVSGPHLSRSRSLWAMVTQRSAAYRPIDWQRDLVSGFRWTAQRSAGRQRRLHRGRPGVDPIRPMEFGRLLHLPAMWICADTRADRQRELRAECSLQLLDFAATNPPGMGIQWACTLDVAVRAANLVLTAWLMRSAETAATDDEFAVELDRLILEHGLFIATHLEWNRGNTGNHYLANITGLLFCAAYFAGREPAEAWLQQVRGALPRELDRQFYADGGHFEGSTCYHAFCTELLTWCLALAEHLAFAADLRDRLVRKAGRAVHLMQTLRTPRGELPQFGDNGSARLFRLTPGGRLTTRVAAAAHYRHLAGFPDSDASLYVDENVLDYRGVEAVLHEGSVENQLLCAVGGKGAVARLNAAVQAAATGREPRPRNVAWVHGARLAYRKETVFESRGNLLDGLRWNLFEDSGLFLARSPALYLAMSAHTNARQKSNRPHGHNDKLGVELYLDGEPVLRDPGTYVYTPLPTRRDALRGTGAHSVPRVAGLEQNRLVDSFLAYPDARCELLSWSPRRLVVGLHFRGVEQEREVSIESGCVRISDACNRPLEQLWNPSPVYSPGYGRLQVNDL